MDEIGIYIHIPFCKSKCYYCDFVSFSNLEERYFLYKEALIKEIKLTKEMMNKKIKSIYIGGGTPTVLPPAYILEILEEVYKHNVNQDAEITIEANPKSLDLNTLRDLKGFGINRLSIGLQTTDDNLLKKLGRIHRYEDFLRNYSDAVKVGFNNISIDLMFGIPEQTIEIFEDTLQRIIKLTPKHISAYSLIVEEGTRFDKMYEEGTLNLPEENTEREMYEILKSELKNNGYNQYEISNFSKDGFEAIHNTIYWIRGDYLGFGLSAHSLYEDYRYENTTDLDLYINSLMNKEIATNKNECLEKIRLNRKCLSQKEKQEEFMFLGLRLIKGISIDEFEREFGMPIFNIYSDQINKNINSGLLKNENSRVYLTSKGVELSNMVMADFLL